MANSQMYDVAVAKKPPMRTHPASRAGLSQQTRSLNQLWASRCMHEWDSKQSELEIMMIIIVIIIIIYSSGFSRP